MMDVKLIIVNGNYEMIILFDYSINNCDGDRQQDYVYIMYVL
jgi:hypothetical protein